MKQLIMDFLTNKYHGENELGSFFGRGLSFDQVSARNRCDDDNDIIHNRFRMAVEESKGDDHHGTTGWWSTHVLL